MINISLGRKGWLAVGLEKTPGEAVDHEKFLPYDSCDLDNNVEVINDEAAKGIREASWGSAIQQETGEGDVEIKMDVGNAPYMLIPALGDYECEMIDLKNGKKAYKHIIKRKDANPPQTATFYFYNTVEIGRFDYATFNTLELSFSDEWITVNGSILAKKPIKVEDGDMGHADSSEITEENVMSFKDATIYFLDDIDDPLETDNKVLVSDFSVTINNNAEAHNLSGDSSPAAISLGEFLAEGSYTIFFEDGTEREKIESQGKRAMMVIFKGKNIGEDVETEEDVDEEIRIKIPSFRVTERSIDTAPSDFVTENPSFVADYNPDHGSIEINVINERGNYLTTLEVSTKDATGIGVDSATLEGELDALEEDDAEVWFMYKKKVDTIWTETDPKETLVATGEFSKEVTTLDSGTDYHFRAIADDGKGKIYGTTKEFTTTES